MSLGGHLGSSWSNFVHDIASKKVRFSAYLGEKCFSSFHKHHFPEKCEGPNYVKIKTFLFFWLFTYLGPFFECA